MSSSRTESQPVLLLKTKSTPTDHYEELFSAPCDGFAFQPEFVPVLQHQFLEDGLQSFRELLQGKKISNRADATFGGLIFTSQRAVEAFAKLVEEGQGDEHWPHLQSIPIYTVGPATTRALRAVPQPSAPLQVFGEQTGTGEALAPFIQAHYGEWYADRAGPPPPLLFLVGEKRRDVIPATLMDPGLPAARRIRVDETVVYGTGVMASFPDDFSTALRRTGGGVRWVVVFSPTGCEAMLEALGLLSADPDPETGRRRYVGAGAPQGTTTAATTFIATIGPTTRGYLKKTFGFDAHVCAQTPSPEGVMAGITTFMRSLDGGGEGNGDSRTES